MLNVNNELPTSTLLAIKVGNEIINNDGLQGVVNSIDIMETDEYLQILFKLDSSFEIIIRKLKQVC